MPHTFDEVCNSALALPCSPTLLPRLAETLVSDDTDLMDLAKLIEVDPVLASSTLRLANSAYFGAAPVETVPDAIMRLGARELYRLAAVSLLGRWMTIELNGYRWEASDFCRTSVITGLATEVLAEETGRVEGSAAYTCGLVHQIGKLPIAFCCADEFNDIRQYRENHDCTWLQAERGVLGFSYADVSKGLLAEWQFPQAFVEVADPESDFTELSDADRCLAAHVHAAHHLSAALGLGQGEDAFFYTLRDDLLLEFGLEPELLEGALPLVFDRASRLLRERLAIGEITF